MKFVFVQKRYHTNRHPMVKALKEGGHEVKYISTFSHSQETYDVLEPTVLGHSPFFKTISNLFCYSEAKKEKKSWPPVTELWEEMRSFDPDVVIVRDYAFRSAIALLFGNFLGTGGILQEQWPKYLYNHSLKKGIADRLYKRIWGNPLIRVTPIKGDPKEGESLPNVYYIPFTVDLELYESPEKREYFRNNIVNIISVGKFTMRRKNHIGLLRAIDQLRAEYDIHLTLVGSLEDSEDENYRQIRSYIRENDLKSDVDIVTNMDYANLQKEYTSHDLFVLPSWDEPAAISPLEAMAAGLPVICSDTNGTKGYIENGQTGYIFRSESQGDLTRKLKTAISSKEQLKEMGNRAVESVNEHHHPSQYCEQIEEIVRQNFNTDTK